MKIYLMRHAHCTDGPRMDPNRSLTDLGKQQCKAIRKYLKDLGVEFDLTISSDFARAVDTVQEVTGERPNTLANVLRPDANVETAWARVAASARLAKADRVLVVTHDPLVMPMLAAICFGFTAEHCIFSHGCMAMVNTDKTDDRHNHTGFRWFVTPKLAMQLREGAALTAIEERALALTENLKRASRARVIDPLVKALKATVAKRFRKQSKAIKAAGLARYRTALHIPDENLDRVYTRITESAYTAGALLAQAQLPKPREAKAKPALPALPGPQRSTYQLEDDLDETTAAQIGAIADKSFLGNMTAAAAMVLVAEQFKEWTGDRAETIALQEVSTAYHGGAADFVDDWRGGNGPVLKTWETEDDPCDECQANADMEAIDSEAPFDSGDDEPPAHPNCRCSISYEPNPSFEGGGE